MQHAEQVTITYIATHEYIAIWYVLYFMNRDYELATISSGNTAKISSNSIRLGNGLISKSIMALMVHSVKAQLEANSSDLRKTTERNTKTIFQRKRIQRNQRRRAAEVN